ncbi:tetratricopeptide repeat protein [Labilibaculum euxinus]|uniref:Tetratricopeptide repeat protein n=1 Tax=Labilibaculum euxinus TaxID=2686357 RepID=A0A7M4D5P4_9BACT|nr:tetratricopeptide repeat protein [Labilibaculum euxinus]MUP37973.1 tetratricopeptide repeat protein [Labilibaculum euxinus]MVB07178.1 tetratricopeptide repeat protein [Labilibaculum euxinus]
MRKLSFILVMLMCVASVSAQKSKVTGAQNYLTSGKLDKAKEAIDEGIQDEKCVAYAKAYLVKGKVYQGIFESPLPAYKKLAEKPLDIAFDAYMKALELDEKGKMEKPVKAQMTNMIPDYTNEAVNLYNAGDFPGALAAFERVLEIEGMDMFKENATIDTAVIFNAGMTAQKADQLDKAAKYYKQSIEYNYGGAKTYANLSKVLTDSGNKEEGVKYLHKGFELYPNDSWMLVELINHYMLGGEPQKAADYLDKAIELDPTNASFYRAKGTLYEKTEEFAKAEEMYTKALSMDPNDFTSQYNLGLLKLNAAIQKHKVANEIMDAKKYNEAIKAVYAEYEAVIPYFEKVLEMQPDEKNSMITLKELYFKLRNEKEVYLEKYNKIKDKLDGME